MTRSHDERQKTFAYLGQHLIEMVQGMSPDEVARYVLSLKGEEPRRVADELLAFLDRHGTERGFARRLRAALEAKGDGSLTFEIEVLEKDRDKRDSLTAGLSMGLCVQGFRVTTGTYDVTVRRIPADELRKRKMAEAIGPPDPPSGNDDSSVQEAKEMTGDERAEAS